MNTQSASVFVRKIFIYLATIEALSTVPLSFFLPSSQIARVVTVGLLTALNASVIATIAKKIWALSLQVSNLFVGGICITIAFESNDISLQTAIMTVGVLYLCLLGLGFFHFSERMLKECFAAQQLALASTFIFWILIDYFRPILYVGQTTSLDHLETALRFLFAGPLALIAIVFVAGLTGWNRYLTALAGVCAGQYSIGFSDLGGALQVYPLIVVGFVLSGIFLLLLVVVVVIPRRRQSRSA